MKFLITVIGMVMIIEGIPYFTMPHRVKEMAEIIRGAENRGLRILGFALMLLGLCAVAIGTMQ